MIPLAALAPVAVKFRAVLSALGVGGTVAAVLVLAIWGPAIPLPFTERNLFDGGLLPRLTASQTALDKAHSALKVAQDSSDAQEAAVIECESRRTTEAANCTDAMRDLDARMQARLARCETRQDRLNAALAPRDGDPDAPPVCLPRRLVPLERLLQH